MCCLRHTRGEAPRSARLYAKVVEWDLHSAGIRRDYAVVLSGLNRAREAVEHLEAACGLEPGSGNLISTQS
jgi:hypothetical protein